MGSSGSVDLGFVCGSNGAGLQLKEISWLVSLPIMKVYRISMRLSGLLYRVSGARVTVSNTDAPDIKPLGNSVPQDYPVCNFSGPNSIMVLSLSLYIDMLPLGISS